MCGIVGCFGGIIPEWRVEKALARMRHRGPDDMSVVVGEEKSFLMGAVRLGFRDIQNGRQPMSFKEVNSPEYSAVCLNGEIYNYQPLRDRIEKEGNFIFDTDCDTELVYRMYKLYGISFIDELRGMFAFALWDGQLGKGYIVNDFLAQKPIYYKVNNDSSITYCSELASMWCLQEEHEALHEAISHDRLKLSLYTKYSRGEQTIYRGVKRLMPGECLEYYAKTRKVKNSRYYNYAERWGLLMKDEDNAAERVEDLLLQAIKRRIEDESSVSCYLSGGLDSSLICAMISKHCLAKSIRTYTLTYADEGYIEGKRTDRLFARVIASIIGSEHMEVKVDAAELGRTLPAVQSTFGEPFSGVPSLYFISKEISRFARYSLSGDGADELFGSYLTHREAAAAGASDDPIKNLIKYYMASWKEYYIENSEAFTLIESELRKEWAGFGLDEWREADPVSKQLAFEAVCIFPYSVLTYVDRLSMVNSVEPRSPFLDQDLWEYVMALPDHYKVREGETKILLKKVASKYLPHNLVFRRKEGFVFPLYQYLVRDEAAIKASILNWCANSGEFLTKDINVQEICARDFHRLRKGANLEYIAAQRLHTLNVLAAAMSREIK